MNDRVADTFLMVQRAARHKEHVGRHRAVILHVENANIESALALEDGQRFLERQRFSE